MRKAREKTIKVIEELQGRISRVYGNIAGLTRLDIAYVTNNLIMGIEYCTDDMKKVATVIRDLPDEFSVIYTTAKHKVKTYSIATSPRIVTYRDYIDLDNNEYSLLDKLNAVPYRQFIKRGIISNPIFALPYKPNIDDSDNNKQMHIDYSMLVGLLKAAATGVYESLEPNSLPQHKMHDGFNLIKTVAKFTMDSDIWFDSTKNILNDIVNIKTIDIPNPVKHNRLYSARQQLTLANHDIVNTLVTKSKQVSNKVDNIYTQENSMNTVSFAIIRYTHRRSNRGDFSKLERDFETPTINHYMGESYFDTANSYSPNTPRTLYESGARDAFLSIGSSNSPIPYTRRHRTFKLYYDKQSNKIKLVNSEMIKQCVDVPKTEITKYIQEVVNIANIIKPYGYDNIDKHRDMELLKQIIMDKSKSSIGTPWDNIIVSAEIINEPLVDLYTAILDRLLIDLYQTFMFVMDILSGRKWIGKAPSYIPAEIVSAVLLYYYKYNIDNASMTDIMLNIIRVISMMLTGHGNEVIDELYKAGYIL